MRPAVFSGFAVASLAVAATLFAAPACFAQDASTFATSEGVCDGAAVSCGTQVTYKVLTEPDGEEPGTVQTGDGSSAAIDANYAGAVRIPQQVSNQGKTYAVIACGPKSFSYCKLSSVEVANTVERIGTQAFYACASLENLSIDSGSCLTSIQEGAFRLVTEGGGLKSINLPASLKTIGESAFTYQSSATSLTFAGDSLESIGNYAFSDCKSLVYAEVPGITAESNGLGAVCFNNDSALSTVVFKGTIASTAISDGSRTFDNCTSLTTVVYRGKKFVPYLDYTAPPTGNTVVPFREKEYFVGFKYSDPTMYFTLTYYPSKADAEAGTNALGSVAIRDDMVLGKVNPQLAASDANGKVIYEGSVCQLPEGYTGWAYEGSPLLNEPIGESLYAYPVDAADLQFGSVQVASSYVYTGNAIEVSPVVCDAAGEILAAGTDYTLSYQRKSAAGAWEPTSDLASMGELRVAVAGVGSHKGSCYAEYSIASAEVGAAFVANGVTYSITKTATLGEAGTVSVGDGTNRAVDAGYEGALEIPAAVSPEGSALSYAVTSVADAAFGSKTEEGACTKLTSVVLPEGVTALGNNAFAHCTALEKAVVPASVTSLGARCFQSCTSLESLAFAGESIASIGTYCFSQCASLEELMLPNVALAFDHVFADCVGLASVEFKGAFGGAGTTQFMGCSRITKVVYDGAVSDAVFESEPSFAFACGAGASAARYTTAAGNLKAGACYAACLAAGTAATVPATVKVNGTSVAVTSVGAGAFKGTKVKTVTVKSSKVKSFKNALKSSKVATVKVPKAKLSAYKKLLAKAKSGKSVKVAA